MQQDRLHRAAALIAKHCRRAGLAITVFSWCCVVEVFLRRRDFAQTCRRLGVGMVRSRTSNQLISHRRARRLERDMKAVDLVLAHWPFGDTCLRRCLVLGALSSDLHPVLVIGTRRAESRIAAHSWLEINGHAIDISTSAPSPSWVSFEQS